MFRNPLLSIRAFRDLWIGQAISMLGDSFYYVVNAFMVKKITGSDAMVGYNGALECLPYLLLGPYAGVVADRFEQSLAVAAALHWLMLAALAAFGWFAALGRVYFGSLALVGYAESLYYDLAPLGIGVSVVNPGFVQTPMTAANDFTMPALLTPAQAAEAIVQGWQRGHYEIHFPRRFTLWLKLMQHLPHAWYFPLVKRGTGV